MPSHNRFDGLNPEPAPFPDHDFTSAPAPEALSPVPVDLTSYESRTEAARRAVVAMGIDWPATIVPEGSSLIDVGTEKLKRDRSAWDRMPLLKDALPAVRAALHLEDRKDFDQKVSDLRLRPSDGRIVCLHNLAATPSQVKGMAYTPHALRQLMSLSGMLDGAPRNFAGALAYITNQERAQIFNRLAIKANPEKTTTLRTKVPHTGDVRVVRAALSEIYGDADDPTVAEIISHLPGIPEGARLSYLPGDAASRFEIVFPSKIAIPNFKAGDIHYASVHARSSEIGLGAFDSFAAFVRAICVNLTTAERHGDTTSVRHVGTDAKVQRRVTEALVMGIKQLEPLLEAIGYSVNIGLDGWEVEKALGRIASLYGEGSGAAETWTATHKQGGYPATVWGMTAAITEAAHSRDSWTKEEDWEGIASGVMMGAVDVVKKGQKWEEILKKGGDEARDMQRRKAMADRARAN